MKPPDYLTDIGRQKWAELLELLGRELRPHERDSLSLLCVSWETYLTALADVRATGTVLTVQNGRLFVNPNVHVVNESHKQILKVSKSFGLDPDKRGEQADEDDEFGSMLARGD
jgi:P27 family predicted phage terminase small subunit